MNKKPKILIADDSEINRAMLSDILAPDYEVLEASDGEEAVACLDQRHSEIALVILDIVMPNMDGFEVLAVMNRNGWVNNIPVIIVSSETSSSYIDHAYQLGASEYINRPFFKVAIQHRVDSTIKLHAKQKHLENIVAEQILDKEKSNMVMVDILSHIVEFRNGESGLHVLHIRTVTEILLKQLRRTCRQYELTPARIALITNASSLHDIGKISIPEDILNKPGKLTKQEFEIVKTHSALGAQMLEGLTYYQEEELVQVARDICRWHHERYDGSGYPDGLKGDEIPISAQVVAIADVYDALTSRRVYKPAYSHEQAMCMILNGECGAFNPLLLNCLNAAGEYLKREVRVRSAGKITRDSIHTLAYDAIHSYNVSDRTLDLLEQERTKYQFYALMTKEIQFEYSYGSDVLILSEWGASHLGIKESIPHPRSSPALLRIFSKEDFSDLCERLKAAVPSSPIVSQVYRLTVRGEPRWYKAVARPIWGLDEDAPPTQIIGKFVDNEEEQSALEMLTLQARHDDLTGLLNRNYAHDEIAQRLSNLKETESGALMVLDLDTFKNVNDNYGHSYGDQMLKAFAERLKSSVRASDLVARIGGDEFLLYMEYKESVEKLVERIFHTVSGTYGGFEVSVSIGVALAPQNGTVYEELFLCADQALYACKQDGRNRWRFYDGSMRGILSSHSQMPSGAAAEEESV
ncbi:diguanylate cyclase [Oscillibacter sp. MSJ-2]|uniref:Diguanylate cyclase n=1 Tax=Dysosmobacter acutus TaxID=2841504 RepID=A0ABS6FFS7_9FIRM|nr:diguanylate cyclase [Dysosmobacter acutus]MBU5628225.1 diguanylate cyclase [Dysosmobacter acutus]